MESEVPLVVTGHLNINIHKLKSWLQEDKNVLITCINLITRMSHQLKNKHVILNIGLAQSDNSNQIQTNVTSSLLGISFTTALFVFHTKS